MELAVMVFILAMGFGEMDKQQGIKIQEQKEQIEQLEETVLKLAGSHAAVAARDLHNTEEMVDLIDMIQRRLDSLDDHIHNHQ